MELLQLQSEDALYFYLKKFLKEKPGAAQLDGSSTAKKNGQVIAVFRYSIDGKRYKLLGDLTRKAIETFITLADEHGSPSIAFKEFTPKSGGEPTLILAMSRDPEGWNCLPFTEKSSDKLKRAA